MKSPNNPKLDLAIDKFEASVSKRLERKKQREQEEKTGREKFGELVTQVIRPAMLKMFKQLERKGFTAKISEKYKESDDVERYLFYKPNRESACFYISIEQQPGSTNKIRLHYSADIDKIGSMDESVSDVLYSIVTESYLNNFMVKAILAAGTFKKLSEM